MKADSNLKALKAWGDSRPDPIKQVVKKYPPEICYRMRDNHGHYAIYSYSEHGKNEPVTVTLVHGADSYLPGIRVFGIDPASLIPCNCGRWEWSDRRQVEEVRRRISAMKN